MDKIKNIFIILTLGLFIIVFTNSCRKYPEDGFFSLLRPSKRIQGDYNLTHFYVNGTDSANNSKNHYYTTDYHIKVPKVEFALYEPSLNFNFDVDMGSYVTQEGCYLGFRNNHKSLYITKNRLFNPNNAILWDIKKLYNRELIFSATIAGNNYEIHLSKKQ